MKNYVKVKDLDRKLFWVHNIDWLDKKWVLYTKEGIIPLSPESEIDESNIHYIPSKWSFGQIKEVCKHGCNRCFFLNRGTWCMDLREVRDHYKEFCEYMAKEYYASYYSFAPGNDMSWIEDENEQDNF